MPSEEIVEAGFVSRGGKERKGKGSTDCAMRGRKEEGKKWRKEVVEMDSRIPERVHEKLINQCWVP